MTTHRIRLTTWVRPWVAVGLRRGATENGETLSSYLAHQTEHYIMDPDVDPEHPEYRGPKQPPANAPEPSGTPFASSAAPQHPRHNARDVSEMPSDD